MAFRRIALTLCPVLTVVLAPKIPARRLVKTARRKADDEGTNASSALADGGSPRGRPAAWSAGAACFSSDEAIYLDWSQLVRQ
jgi:hypothetical protein